MGGGGGDSRDTVPFAICNRGVITLVDPWCVDWPQVCI